MTQIVEAHAPSPYRAGARAVILAALVIQGAAGCSSRDGYEFVRQAGESSARCEQEPTVAAQRECEAHYQQSYEAYREQRREALEEDDAD